MTDTLQNSLTLFWYATCIGLGARIGWNFNEGAYDLLTAFMTAYRRARK